MSGVGNRGGGGTHRSEVYGYVLLWWPPPFQAPPPLQRPTVLHLVSVLMPFYFHFSKNSAFLGQFLSNFVRISAPNTLILAKICSQVPNLLRKNLFCRPYFWKPVWHIPTKKIWVLPRGQQHLVRVPKLAYNDSYFTMAHKLSLVQENARFYTSKIIVKSYYWDSYNVCMVVRGCYRHLKLALGTKKIANPCLMSPKNLLEEQFFFLCLKMQTSWKLHYINQGFPTCGPQAACDQRGNTLRPA